MVSNGEIEYEVDWVKFVWSLSTYFPKKIYMVWLWSSRNGL